MAAHVEVLVNYDHRRADGFEEVHSFEVKVDGLDAALAWDRATEAVYGFLKAEVDEQERVDRRAQAAEGPWCNHNHFDPKVNTGYLCNLPPNHRGRHENFQTGRSWPQYPREEQCA